MKRNSNQLIHDAKVQRHCMVVHAYYPVEETRVEREALALSAKDIEVDVICLKLPGELGDELVGGAHVYRLPVGRNGGGLLAQALEYLSFFILAIARLTTLHLRQHYDVVQVHNLPDFLVFVALIPKLTGSKIIIDLHDLMPEFYSELDESPMDGLVVRMIRWQEWLSCRFADHIITVTELWRQTLIERGQPKNKISVIMNVADSHIFHPQGHTKALGDDRFRLIYHGVMAKRHGLDLVLKAIHQIAEVAPNTQLILHGGGANDRVILEGLVDELKLRDYVQFSQSILPTTELPKLLLNADLAVVPYRNGIFTGGILPTKLMEYAALGIPAIAARTPAIAAYFDETSVQFFTPGDVDELAACILALYNDRPRLANLARNILKFNDRYNWSKVSAEYVALVERLRTRKVEGN
jgi:glycosyltransferase involved in cell wall biosynthesis